MEREAHRGVCDSGLTVLATVLKTVFSDQETLHLRFNDLSGELPAELVNLANLTRLYLDGNQLSGCVPSSLSGRLDMEYSDARMATTASSSSAGA